MGCDEEIDSQFFGEKLVRMCWEKPYLEALIDHLRPSGNVLEVGFALGYSSTRIQTFNPKHHTIIESVPEIAVQATQWASAHENVSVMQGQWENILPTLGVFDAIFFNDFNPNSVLTSDTSRQVANLAIQKGKDLISNIKKTFPQIISIRYADADIDEFFNNMGRFDSSQMSSFLYELMQNGHISEGQLDAAVSKYQLQKNVSHTSSMSALKTDPTMVFLQACLKNHMHKGSRFSCFSWSPISKFEHPEFFDLIITDPDYDYQETFMQIDVPESCKYYKYNEALIITLEKQK